MRIGRDLMQTAGKALRINITTLGPLVLPLSEKLIYAGNLVARKARPPASARPQRGAWPPAGRRVPGRGGSDSGCGKSASRGHLCWPCCRRPACLQGCGVVGIWSAGRLTGAAPDGQALGLRSLKPYVPDFSTAFQHFCIHPGGKAVIEEARCPARPRASLRCQAPPHRACGAPLPASPAVCCVQAHRRPALCAQTRLECGGDGCCKDQRLRLPPDRAGAAHLRRWASSSSWRRGSACRWWCPSSASVTPAPAAPGGPLPPLKFSALAK